MKPRMLAACQARRWVENWHTQWIYNTTKQNEGKSPPHVVFDKNVCLILLPTGAWFSLSGSLCFYFCNAKSMKFCFVKKLVLEFLEIILKVVKHNSLTGGICFEAKCIYLKQDLIDDFQNIYFVNLSSLIMTEWAAYKADGQQWRHEKRWK